jgi:23S rRNA (pseudouridine1915-N3)-methyltransferase
VIIQKNVGASRFWGICLWIANAQRVACGILLGMNATIAHIGPRFAAGDPLQPPTLAYLERCSSLLRCSEQAFKTEDALFAWLDRQRGRTQALLVLLDSRGKQMTSEAFAAWLGAQSERGIQHIVFAIGPASGWSEASRARATLLLSLGAFTLAHALARLVLAEQLYRATTILTGHPYHTGH